MRDSSREIGSPRLVRIAIPLIFSIGHQCPLLSHLVIIIQDHSHGVLASIRFAERIVRELRTSPAVYNWLSSWRLRNQTLGGSRQVKLRWRERGEWLF